ncbi:MAG TPA: calcium-binding protein [Solirubrobacterales bacterium]
MKKAALLLAMVVTMACGLAAPTAQAEEQVTLILLGGTGDDFFGIELSNDGTRFVIDSRSPLEVGGGICSHPPAEPLRLNCDAPRISGFEIRMDAGNDTVELKEPLTVPATIDGGEGNDLLLGGGGSDWLIGGAGDDSLFGGGGNDRLSCGDGDDFGFGGRNEDTISGDAGQDFLYGGGGDDALSGGTGDDGLFGGVANDLLRGGPGDDGLVGDEGNDRGNGGVGRDKITGGPGNDSFVVGSRDIASLGPGRDQEL